MSESNHNSSKNYCQCGCGLVVKPNRSFRVGHWMRVHYRDYVGKKYCVDRILIRVPDHPRAGNYGYIKESHYIAEKAMGKFLPPRANVHHVDGNPLNNNNNNLVVCENRAYHGLLHQRTNALRDCGNASWRKCRFCKKYDDPKNLVTLDRNNRGGGILSYHKKCSNEYEYKRKKNKK